jgi:anti-sigma-K factor RskA
MATLRAAHDSLGVWKKAAVWRMQYVADAHVMSAARAPASPDSPPNSTKGGRPSSSPPLTSSKTAAL